jgi:hypothetical protein
MQFLFSVQIIFENNTCYWPSQLVTVENLQARFDIKHPVLRMANAPKG